MRTLAQLEALVRRNAEACETARTERCECHCGGAMHGRRHSAEWVSKVAIQLSATQIAAAELERKASQPDLWEDS